jgi:hypothetical protein
MALGGLYAELFALQARQYVDMAPGAFAAAADGEARLGTRFSTIDAPVFQFGAGFGGSIDAEGGGNAAPP